MLVIAFENGKVVCCRADKRDEVDKPNQARYTLLQLLVQIGTTNGHIAFECDDADHEIVKIEQ